MSWVSDYFEGQYKKYTGTLGYIGDQIQSVIPDVGIGPNIKDAYSGYTDFIKSENQKAPLRSAELTSFIGGLPLVGNVVRGIEGINQLEDLYNNSGKVPAYPASGSPGAQGLASAAAGIARKIEDGVHDLGVYYSGDVDLNSVFDSVNGQPLNKMTHPAIRKSGGN